MNDDEKSAAAAAATATTLQEGSDATESEASSYEVGTDLEAAAVEDVPVDLPRDAEVSTTNDDDDGGNFEMSSTSSSSDTARVEVQSDNDEFRSGNDEGALLYHSTESNENFHPTAQAVYPEVVANHRIQQAVAERKKNIAVAEMVETDEEAQVPHPHESYNQKNCLLSLCNTRNKKIIVSVLTVAVIAIIVGVSVGVSNKNKKEATASSAAISDEAQRVRLSSVASFLIDEGISLEDAVMTAGSPQNRATSFMAIEDVAQLEVPLSKADPLAFKFIQRYALATFYYALGGESWDYTMNFLTPDDTCLWFQTILTTGGQRNNFGAQCSLNGHVRVILLPWNNMAGEVPPEIGLFTALEFFAIPSNRDVRGALPSEMKKLTNLDFLMLSQNYFTGPVPEWIGDLTKLTSLVLGDNAFQSSIPMTIRNLDQLVLLSLDGNRLYGQLDTIEQLTNLQFLYLGKNQLKQTLGSNTLRNLTKLKQLDLGDNIFDGGVPHHVLHMSSLEVLDLSGNMLSGKLPSTIPRNSALNSLFLHGNQLSGDIPSSFFNLTALNQLDLSDNKFTGLIPSFLGNFTNMSYLFLSNNDFDRAPIPEFLPQRGNLRVLSLKSTNRTGTIPSFIGEMTSLLFLDLVGNELTGSLPTELGLLTYLGLLLLNRNNVRRLRKCCFTSAKFAFSSNFYLSLQLTGTIPSQVSNMTTLGKY
jgi:Leucine-rich repeat (LRR) protein